MSRTNFKARTTAIAAGAAALLVAAAPAAAKELMIDLNSFGLQVDYTQGSSSGTGTFSADGVTNIADISEDGVDLLGGSVLTGVGGFTGSFTITPTAVDPGPPIVPTEGTISDFNFVLKDGSGGEYSVAGGSGFFERTNSGRYSFDVDTSDGSFNAATFAGVDVSKFFAESPGLAGEFFNFELTESDFANLLGSDSFVATTDAEITVVVPSPSAALGGLGLIAIAGIRRVRRAALDVA